jgi:tetratricopeptide (TPR) repeat protein
MKKTTISTICILLLTLSVWAQNYNSPCVISYRKSLLSFNNKDYAKALQYSEDAIDQRKSQMKEQEEKLRKSLSSRAVASAGDDISKIVKVLTDRSENDILDIINYYTKKYGINYFNNSISNLMDFLRKIEEYPEAQKIIADVYKIEGEYDIAEEYYLKALSNIDVFDVHDDKYEILYLLADISRLKKDYNLMEKRLLNIFIDDKYYLNNSLQNNMVHTISQNKKDSVEKYFELYRATSYFSLKAYSLLYNYYEEKGETDKALRLCSLATITSFSKIYDVVKKRDSDFKYITVSSLLEKASEYNDINAWCIENDVWNNFYKLAELSYKNGYTIFSKELLQIIIKNIPDEKCQKKSVLFYDKNF